MYAPTIYDWTMYVGTIGFFIALIFLFVRMLPVISIFEVRTLLPQAEVKNHGEDGHTHEHSGQGVVGVQTDHMDQINLPKGEDTE
jgi:molybdopterin-containing oxidoreductase family membrane subunit